MKLNLTKILLVMSYLGLSIVGKSQGVAINSNGQRADTSAILDISSTSKGLLIPRVTSPVFVNSPAHSLLVYKIGSALLPDSGFYYNAGTPRVPSWQKLITSLNFKEYSWGTTGNSNTNAASNFIGTTDNNPLVFRINFEKAGIIDFFSTMIGYHSGPSNSGVNNTFLGTNSGFKNTTGDYNTYFGNYGAYSNNGDNNVCIGSFAGFGGGFNNNTKFDENVFIGSNAGQSNISGSKSVFIGASTGINNKIGNGNVFLGYKAGFLNEADSNCFVGYESGYNSRIGKWNTFYGFQAGRGANTPTYSSGNYNLAIGFQAAYINRGDSNVYIGNKAGINSIAGSSNLAIGNSSLISSSDGNRNTAIGNGADVAAGNNNSTVIGYRSYADQSNSVILGSVSGINSATVTTSVGIGNTAPQATLHITRNPNGTPTMRLDGEQNISLFYTGVRQDTYINGGMDLSNVYIGSQGKGNVIMVPGGGGKVGIGTDVPTATLTVNGDVEKPGGGVWNAISDIRVKKNINIYTKGLKEVLAIHPVSFQYNGKGQTVDNGITYVGVIAQEIEKILPGTVSQRKTNDFSDQRYYNGTELTYTLVNAIHEQQAQIEEIKKQNGELKIENTSIKEKINELLKK